MHKTAIVMTVRSPGERILTFARYHLALGFNKIYFMFDDPSDPDRELLRDVVGAEIIPIDEPIKQEWRRLHSYPLRKDAIAENFLHRQILNAEYGVQLALSDGITWLLHLDDDELFWLGDKSLSKHIDELDRKGLMFASYANYEALPDRVEVENPFLEVRSFKKPPVVLRSQGINLKSDWPEGRKYFNYYSNGKSITRVGSDVISLGAHSWASIFHLTKGLEIKTEQYIDPVILHFPGCGFAQYRKKFRILGNFGDNLFDLWNTGKDFRVDAKLDIYPRSREAFQKNDESLAMEIYKSRIMMEPKQIDRLVSVGVIERIDVRGRIQELDAIQ